MGAAKAARLIEGRNKGRRGHRPDPRGRRQSLHHRIVGHGRLELCLGVGQLLGQVFPEHQQRPDRGLQGVRELEGLHVPAKVVGIPRPDPQSLAAHQRADERDGPPPRPHEQVARQELAAYLALHRRHPMGRAIGAEPGRLGQHPSVAPIRFYPPAPLRIHRGVVWIGNDHLVAQRLDRLRHPFALGRRLEEHARGRAVREHGDEFLSRALDPPLDHLALRRQDADLTFPLMDIDANMLHGWSPSLRCERVNECGAQATTWGMTSRFILSSQRPRGTVRGLDDRPGAARPPR